MAKNEPPKPPKELVQRGTQPGRLTEGTRPREQAGTQPTGKGPSGNPPNTGGAGGKK
jgi:hypothetical protein